MNVRIAARFSMARSQITSGGRRSRLCFDLLQNDVQMAP